MSTTSGMDISSAVRYAQQMEDEPFRVRLQRIRKSKRISQRELARRAKVSNSTVSETESGKIWPHGYPPPEQIIAYAEALEINLRELAPDLADMLAEAESRQRDAASAQNALLQERLAIVEAELATLQQVQRLHEDFMSSPRWTKRQLLRRIGAFPIIDVSRQLDQMASMGPDRRGNIPQGLESVADMEVVPLPDGGQLYAIRVVGDCMEPKIEPGDTVRFDPELDAEDGDLVVAAQDGEKALVKWLEKRATLQRLISLNGEPILIDERIEIVGVVKDIVKPPPPKPRRRQAPKSPEGQGRLPEA